MSVKIMCIAPEEFHPALIGNLLDESRRLCAAIEAISPHVPRESISIAAWGLVSSFRSFDAPQISIDVDEHYWRNTRVRVVIGGIHANVSARTTVSVSEAQIRKALRRGGLWTITADGKLSRYRRSSRAAGTSTLRLVNDTDTPATA